MKTGKYLIFTVSFWSIATFLMFLLGLRYDHWDQVIIRYIYFPIAGLLITSAKTLIYHSEPFRRITYPLIAVVVLSALASFVTAIILNPITFLILNIDVTSRHLEKMSTGTLHFGFLYLLWSVLYFRLSGRSLLRKEAPENKECMDRIGVEDQGRMRVISVDDIECFAASGDYVEIHLADKSYLKKETISALEALLDSRKFRRVHRSTIVNANKISGIEAKGSGAYSLTLASGRVVSSSRSYRSVIMDLKSGK